jgi:hypothetical protein
MMATLYMIILATSDMVKSSVLVTAAKSQVFLERDHETSFRSILEEILPGFV